MLYPLTFHPIFKERVWGGRNLERLFSKTLPPDAPIGESWEITERPEGVSVIASGLLAGKDLHWLMEHHARDVLGPVASAAGQFPLLVKLLDAQDKLSLQVHPPAEVARRLGGEPKTEMWYIADAQPGAELHVGLRRGATRPEFERRIKDGTVAGCFHQVKVRAGDVMFLPSGRVHAIGAGIVIFEIQQNSDTTYRVFDWNRRGLDGQPRALHVEQSLQCIDFDDFEPMLIQARFAEANGIEQRLLVEDALFSVREYRADAGKGVALEPGRMMIVAAVSGRLTLTHQNAGQPLTPGQFVLVPACLSGVAVEAASPARFLIVTGGWSNG